MGERTPAGIEAQILEAAEVLPAAERHGAGERLRVIVGVVGVSRFRDDEGRIVSFQEKPEQPRGRLAGIALYFYPRSSLPLIRRYIEEGNNPDQPGRLVEWLHTRVPFYTSRLGGRWYDIGSRETLAAANREFAQS